jgi:hypothetical protein
MQVGEKEYFTELISTNSIFGIVQDNHNKEAVSKGNL